MAELTDDEYRERFLTTAEAAQHLGMESSTLRSWRSREIGPRYVKVGRSIRYEIDDLDRFLEYVDPLDSHINHEHIPPQF